MKTASPMKCKSWSNKINNFVVRRLKSIKVNGQPQQQILSPCSTMPAMPKEKATAVSLNESNFSELKLKELAINSNATNTNSNTNSNSISNNCNSNSTATATTTMATTATSRMQTPTHHLPTAAAAAVQSITAVTAATVTTTTQPHWAQRQTQQQQQQQQYTQSRNSLCGCGNVSAVIPETVGSLNHGSSRYLTNGHSSPLAAAMAANGVDTLSPDHAPTCCRYQQQQQEDQEQQQQQQQQHQQQQYLQHNGYNGTTEAAVGAANANAPTTNNTSAAINIISSAATLSANAGGASASSPTNVAVTPPKKTPNDYIFGKYIGEGSFSNVYLAVDVHTKREYAIKVCEKRHIIREDKQEYVRRERESLHMMTNVPGFVNLSCTFQDRRSLYFVMTYAKNGDLLPYINKVGSFDVDCTRHYVAELVLACEEMHSRNVVHRDLKPENILLDEDMHTLIADFGSAKIFTAEDRANFRTAFANGTTMSNTRLQRNSNNRSDEDEDDDTNDDTNDTGSDEDHQQRTSSSRHGRYLGRRRRGSFVGTAQYVSPEVVVNGLVTPAADLWALGCIVYQMISGLPPFRGSNDYSIFKDIISCNIDFPQGFDKDAEDLVRRLLKVQPEERLGAKDVGATYESIRQHPFFNGIDFNTVRQQTPPPIYPYLPGVSKDENFSSHYFMSQNLEPGLGDKQLTRLLGMELGTSLGSDDDECRPNGREIEKKTVRKNIYDLSESEKQIRLEQQKSDKWHVFADNEVILKKGYINKRKGLFARRRMLLLTTGPRLIYIDPVHMVKKGEIPWSPELRVEPKNFKIFFVHTPNRTYYLDDPDSYSLEWVDAIERMRKLTYPDCDTATAARTTATSFSTTATGTSPKSSHRTNSPTSLTNGSGSSSSGNMLSAAFAAVSIRTTKTASN